MRLQRPHDTVRNRFIHTHRLDLSLLTSETIGSLCRLHNCWTHIEMCKLSVRKQTLEDNSQLSVLAVPIGMILTLSETVSFEECYQNFATLIVLWFICAKSCRVVWNNVLWVCKISLNSVEVCCCYCKNISGSKFLVDKLYIYGQ